MFSLCLCGWELVGQFGHKGRSSEVKAAKNRRMKYEHIVTVISLQKH